MKTAWRSFLYLASALVTGAIGFGLLLVGWLAVGLLALTPLSVPALVAFRWGVGALAGLEAQLARLLLGKDVGPQKLTSGGAGYWGRGTAVLGDRTFWRQHTTVVARTFLGWPLAVGAISLVGSALWFVFLPVYYPWVDFHLGSFDVDTLAEALYGIPFGLAGLVVALALVHWTARGWARLALPLLGPTRGPAKSFFVPHAVAVAVADLVVLIVWASVGGPFWPKWVLAATTLTISLHAWLLRTASTFARLAGVAVFLEAFQIALWAFGGAGYFWPMWTALGFVLAVGVSALVIRRGRLGRRIEVLETTRAGAVDVQESELRRIERDLHDGAQARLVALGMNLGLAEQKLAGDPEAARDLVAEARAGVEQALRELRDLARGVHPPVLTDRGLGAAAASLAHASAIPVVIDEDVAERPPAVVETAAYFVVAEAMANAAKHADATRIDVRIVRRHERLVVEVSDDGRGGADEAGSGLVGLKRRVEALDGTLAVTSPSGGGTVLRAELPCES
ncbi:MAG TPA: sensor domain-containing protein [Gaiellaceae bacterium]|nr:sensor domain-containing protein [Gaiellaceae bacterium]